MHLYLDYNIILQLFSSLSFVFFSSCNSPPVSTALQEVFERIDLDGNGAVSRSEFDFFQELSSGEMCDDDAWASIQGQLSCQCRQSIRGSLSQ